MFCTCHSGVNLTSYSASKLSTTFTTGSKPEVEQMYLHEQETTLRWVFSGMYDTTFLILQTLFLDSVLILNLGTNMSPSHPTFDSIFQLVQVTVIQLVDGVTAFANCDNQIAPTVAYLSTTAKYFPKSF